MVDASVVVCTRNRADLLEGTLQSINADQSQADAEIIVVDNGSTDRTSEVIAAAASASRHPMRRIEELSRGQCAARNAGIRGATGNVVLFTDDDVRVHDGWIDHLTKAFDDITISVVGGRIIPIFLADPPRWIAAGMAPGVTLNDYGPEPFKDDPARLPLGANMAIRADLLKRSDEPFDTRLGHNGKISMGHDEWYLFRRLPGRIVYRPEAVIDHVIDQRRMDYAYVRRVYFHLGIGKARSRRLAGDPQRPLYRQAVRAARLAASAQMMKRRSEDELPLAAVGSDFESCLTAGMVVERVLGRWPGAVDRVAAVRLDE